MTQRRIGLAIALAACLSGCGGGAAPKPEGTVPVAGRASDQAAYPGRVWAEVGVPLVWAPKRLLEKASVSDTLPPGLTLAADGTIRGTPRAPSPLTAFEVTDARGPVGQLWLEVLAPIGGGTDLFVAPQGSDGAAGTRAAPLASIEVAVTRATPGTTIWLRGGSYPGNVSLRGLAGTPGQPITVRGYPGEAVTIDAGQTLAWRPAREIDAAARADEWVSEDGLFANNKAAINRGTLPGLPYARLLTYSRLEDLRADNQRWTHHTGDPTQLRPWTYFGPGLYADPVHGRVHLRLAPTGNHIPGLADYPGADPRAIDVRVSARDDVAVRIENSAFVRLVDLTLRGGGDVTVAVTRARDIVFEGVDIQAATMGLELAHSESVRFLHGRIDGGVPSWSFRSDFKDNYKIAANVVGKADENNLVRKTSRALVYVGAGNRDLELAHCELANGHDVYFAGRGADLHHCRLRNIHDEGVFISHTDDIDDLRIHDNVFERVLSALSGAGKRVTGTRFVYRNLIDLRQPTAGNRPGLGDSVWRLGHVFKGALGEGPFYFYQNTVLVADPKAQASLLLFRALPREGKPVHARWFLNNIVVAGGASRALGFVPEAGYLADASPEPEAQVFRSDGNLWVRPAGKAPLFRCMTAVPKARCATKAYRALKDVTRATGFERHSEVAARPGFASTTDLRLAPDSPARARGVALPAWLPDSRPETATPDAGARPTGDAALRVGPFGRFSY